MHAAETHSQTADRQDCYRGQPDCGRRTLSPTRCRRLERRQLLACLVVSLNVLSVLDRRFRTRAADQRGVRLA